MGEFHHALHIDNQLCIGCTHCMRVCPTEALRVLNGKAVLDPSKCIDCGECFRNCPVNAINIEQDDFNHIFNYEYRVLLIPSIFIGQFPFDKSIADIHKTLIEIGFTHIYEVEHGADIIEEQMNEFLGSSEYEKPAISCFCPAVVRLVQVRFPSLTENLLLIKPPHDISAYFMRKKLMDAGAPEDSIGVFYVTPCAAKIAAIKSNGIGEKSPIDGVINMDFLYNKVLRTQLNKKDNSGIAPEYTPLTEKAMKWSLTTGENANAKGRSLAIDEIHNVIRFLDRVENDEAIAKPDFLELRACDQSCAGGVLTTNNRFLTAENLRRRAELASTMQDKRKEENLSTSQKEYLKDLIFYNKIQPRSIIKLDEDMNIAMLKMQKMEDIYKQLPKVDCGICGAPSCRALSEDITKDKAEIVNCIFIQRRSETVNNSIEYTHQIMRSVWGTNKF